MKRDASWVIREKTQCKNWTHMSKECNCPPGEVVMETFNPRLVAALNTVKYEAVPILDYLIDLNRRIKVGNV